VKGGCDSLKNIFRFETFCRILFRERFESENYVTRISFLLMCSKYNVVSYAVSI
jgi:hypothetical protein